MIRSPSAWIIATYSWAGPPPRACGSGPRVKCWSAILKAAMNWTAIAAVFLALGVSFGAFGAHLLQGHLDAYSMTIWERAVMYHFFHALGLLAVPALARVGLISARAAAWTCRLLAAGIVLFAGSLYVLALTGERLLGAVTPFGGVAFIAAWV